MVFRKFVSSVLLLAWLLPCAALAQVNVAAASDLKFALPEVATAFERRGGEKLQISFGSSGNFRRPLAAIGVDVSEYENEVSPDPRRSFFKLDLDGFTLDTLPRIKADIPFGEAYARKESVELDGVPIHYIGYEDLLKDKQSSARQKDEEDIKHLRRQRGEE